MNKKCKIFLSNCLNALNMVNVESKNPNNITGKKYNASDRFYRASQSRIYISDMEFDSSSIKYNYLGLKLEDKDGRENKTHYSYDELLNLKEVDNADNSQSLVSDTYQTNFETFYGMVYGLINLKEYTDEEGNHSQKYYNAVGNLIREVKINPNGSGDTEYIFTDYKYDELYMKYHNGSYHIINTFNARSWLTSSLSAEDKFSYALDYFYNGNIKAQRLMGSYRLNYSGEQREVSSTFRYDNSNRLLNVRKTNVKVYSPEETFTYDKDGNIQTLVRDYSGDNFSYQYYEGTNRLRSVDGGVTQHYAYDYNGNLISDSRRNITSIKYDNRNLPTEMIISSIFMAKSYKIEYKYDETGNRLRKRVYENIPSSGESPIGWKLIKDEVYVRDAGGKEIAVYENSNLSYYNLWGNGLEGKTKKDERGNTKYYYYYKDHLGSVRAVMDGSFGTTVQAQDYDAWGDIFRTYTSDDISQNKFTSKERDVETGYDYFGARYYDSKVGNWLSPDPLFEKHIGWSPYNYVLRNPYMLIDPDGKQIDFSKLSSQYQKAIIEDLFIITGYSFNVNSQGYLKIDRTKSEVFGNSSTTANDFANEIDSYDKSIITVVAHKSKQTTSLYDPKQEGILLNPLEISSYINPDNVMNGLNIHTFGWGMVFLHELLHSKFKGLDPNDRDFEVGKIGDIEKYLNKIRSDLGKDWGEIQTHKAIIRKIAGRDYGIIPFSRDEKDNYYIKSEFLGEYGK